MPIAGLHFYETQINSTHPNLMMFLKFWNKETLFMDSELIMLSFQFNKLQMSYTLKSIEYTEALEYHGIKNDKLISFLSTLNNYNEMSIDFVWNEYRKSLFFNPDDLLEFYKENSHHDVVDLKEIKKSYAENIIFRYSN